MSKHDAPHSASVAVRQMQTKLEETNVMSAPYPVDYIMNVKLDYTLGCDIPLADRRIKLTNRRDAGTAPEFDSLKGTEFNFNDEDLWLFAVHLHDAEMEFAIGGTDAIYATSHPNWHDVSESNDRSITMASFRDSGMGGSVDRHSFATFNLEWNRYVAIRAPKMSNPAITVRGNGNYASLSWVGLFVKVDAEDKSNFIALKTSSRLLPKYGERNWGASWWTEASGADVTGRTITMFPKQLYGTEGNNAVTYDKFVTDDPSNTVGAKHLEIVKDKLARDPRINATGRGRSYTWNSDKVTTITGFAVTFMSIGGRLQRFERRTEFNYSTGRSLPPKDIPGWKLLLDLFGNFAKIVGAIVTRDLQAALEGVKGFGNLDDNSAPDVAGVITSLAIIGKAIREKNKETLSVNTDGVDQIAKKHSITDEDYGLDGPRKHTLLLPFEESFGYVLQKNSREEKYKEAEAMYRQALAGCEEVVGREHPDTLTSVNNLGLVLSMLGNYEEAEAMHRRVLEARKKMLGLEHPDTLTSVRNLVNALDSQGKYEEAEAMYRQALDALEKVLGG